MFAGFFGKDGIDLINPVNPEHGPPYDVSMGGDLVHGLLQRCARAGYLGRVACQLLPLVGQLLINNSI